MSIYDNKDDLIIGVDNVFQDIITETKNKLIDVGANVALDLSDTIQQGGKRLSTTLSSKKQIVPVDNSKTVVKQNPITQKVSPLYIAAIALVIGSIVLFNKRKK